MKKCPSGPSPEGLFHGGLMSICPRLMTGLSGSSRGYKFVRGNDSQRIGGLAASKVERLILGSVDILVAIITDAIGPSSGSLGIAPNLSP